MSWLNKKTQLSDSIDINPLYLNKQNPSANKQTKVIQSSSENINNINHINDLSSPLNSNDEMFIKNNQESLVTFEENKYDDLMHYDELSEHASHESYVDDDKEEEKIEEEIINNLSHLQIDRNEINPNSIDSIHHSPNPFQSLSQSFLSYKTHAFGHNDNDVVFGTNDNINNDDDDDDCYLQPHHDHDGAYENAGISSGAGGGGSPKMNKILSLRHEFVNNETFWKYIMLYGTIYGSSKLYFTHVHPSMFKTETGNLSKVLLLITHGIVTSFKGKHIWNKSHSQIYSQSQGIMAETLTENEMKYVDIEQAFYVFMIILSFFSNKKHKTWKRLSYLFGIGCIFYLKKYGKIGSLYVYCTFWMQLSSLLLNTSRMLTIFVKNAKQNVSVYRIMSKTLSFVFALIACYSDIFLFTKVMKPIVSNLYRNQRSYLMCTASVLFLCNGYYRCGRNVSQTILALNS